MPETTVRGKSVRCLSARDPPRDRGAEGRLTRCDRRNLYGFNGCQGLQAVPVKCQRGTRGTARSVLKLPGPTVRPTILKSFQSIPKKSLSMTDLSPSTLVPDLTDLGSRTVSQSLVDHCQTEGGIGGGSKKMPDNKVAISHSVDGRAGKLVCHVLVINSWRRRREEIGQLRGTIDRLNQQLKHMQMQILVLRRLLKTENQRVGQIAGEMHRTKSHLDEIIGERDALKTEKENMETEVKRLNEVSEERLVKAENLRNDLLTARNQLSALDGQIAKDRDKLLKLREDKRILLEKVSASEALAGERASRASRAETAVDELQIRLAAQVALTESSQQHTQRLSKELRAKEEERGRLEKRLKLSEESEKALSLRAASLESQLADQQAELLRIESLYNSQTREINELKEKLIRQSQEGGWSSRMLQLAGTVVRAPRAILRTLSFLSNASTHLPS